MTARPRTGNFTILVAMNSRIEATRCVDRRHPRRDPLPSKRLINLVMLLKRRTTRRVQTMLFGPTCRRKIGKLRTPEAMVFIRSKNYHFTRLNINDNTMTLGFTRREHFTRNIRDLFRRKSILIASLRKRHFRLIMNRKIRTTISTARTLRNDVVRRRRTIINNRLGIRLGAGTNFLYTPRNHREVFQCITITNVRATVNGLSTIRKKRPTVLTKNCRGRVNHYRRRRSTRGGRCGHRREMHLLDRLRRDFPVKVS